MAKQWKIYANVKGAKELAKELKQMGEDAKSVLSKAAMAGGNIALEDARKNCPVDTGKLRDSLNIKVSKESETKATITIDYDRSLKYGTFVELGARGREPKPFLRNAVDNNEQLINQAVVDTVRKELK